MLNKDVSTFNFQFLMMLLIESDFVNNLILEGYKFLLKL